MAYGPRGPGVSGSLDERSFGPLPELMDVSSDDVVEIMVEGQECTLSGDRPLACSLLLAA